MSHPLTVLGFGYVAPHARPHDALLGVDSELPKLDLALLERTLRRGLSEVTRLFMHAAKLALSDAATDADEVHVIFGSAFGEIATAEALLAEAYDANGSSPARFRHSVHNTAPGLFSISSKNYLPCTAVAAGWETVAMGLFEAAAQLARPDIERVLLVFAEERVPTALSAEHNYGPLAAAFVLGRGASGDAVPRATLSCPRRAHADVVAPEVAAQRADHPLAPVLQLARMLEARTSGTLAVSASVRHDPREQREPPWVVEVLANEAWRAREPS